jgi:hypothetical protein
MILQRDCSTLFSVFTGARLSLLPAPCLANSYSFFILLALALIVKPRKNLPYNIRHTALLKAPYVFVYRSGFSPAPLPLYIQSCLAVYHGIVFLLFSLLD